MLFSPPAMVQGSLSELVGSSASGEELYSALHTPLPLEDKEEVEGEGRPARKQINKTRFKHRKQ